jgi:hypothetical protein
VIFRAIAMMRSQVSGWVGFRNGVGARFLPWSKKSKGPLLAEDARNGGTRVSLCGLNVVGSVGNSMTLEDTGYSSTGAQSVNFVGHDAT